MSCERSGSRIDFDFIYDEVRDLYGDKGNVSVPPPVILKMMLLLILYNVRSERELMMTIALRVDWVWFLGYDLDSEIPISRAMPLERTLPGDIGNSKLVWMRKSLPAVKASPDSSTGVIFPPPIPMPR
jgi:hypothetical protein